MQNILPGAGVCASFMLHAVIFLVLLFFLWFNHRDFREGSELLVNSFKLGRVSTEMG